MIVKEALHYAISILKPHYHVDEVGPIARWIIGWIVGMNDAELLSRSDYKLTQSQQTLLTSSLTAHIQEHKPLQYIVGSVPFMELTIQVKPPILIPRPETEYWCSWLIEQLRPLAHQQFTILDMCTGSGCIALALAHYLPASSVYAVDISPKACALAQENAHKNNTEITIIESDLFTQLPSDLRFDLIVSNPPYISHDEWESLDPSVRAWEDPQALLAREQGLALLNSIIMQVPQWLHINESMRTLAIPQLVVEIGYNQGKLVPEIFAHAGFSLISTHKDLFGNDRFVTGRLNGHTS